MTSQQHVLILCSLKDELRLEISNKEGKLWANLLGQAPVKLHGERAQKVLPRHRALQRTAAIRACRIRSAITLTLQSKSIAKLIGARAMITKFLDNKMFTLKILLS